MKAEISDKISSIIEKIDGKTRYYIFIGVLLAAFLLDYFFLMSPQLASLRKISPEIKIVSEDIKKAQGDVNKVNTYKKDLEQISKKLDQASLKIKSREDVPFILEHIANIAGETGVKIDQIMPDAIGQELLTENNQRKYFDLPIYMEARSGYHDFGQFLNRIEQDDVSLRVSSFTIVPTTDNRYHLVKLTFKATVFEEVRP